MPRLTWLRKVHADIRSALARMSMIASSGSAESGIWGADAFAKVLWGIMQIVRSFTVCHRVQVCVCVCESYIGKPIGTRAVPQFTTGVAKPLTQIEPGKTEHHPPL